MSKVKDLPDKNGWWWMQGRRPVEVMISDGPKYWFVGGNGWCACSPGEWVYIPDPSEASPEEPNKEREVLHGIIEEIRFTCSLEPHLGRREVMLDWIGRLEKICNQ